MKRTFEDSGEGRPFVVVYDGTCRVCTRMIELLASWDRACQLEILASQDPGVAARFPSIPAEAYEEALQLIGPGGQTWQGAAAVEQLIRLLPKGRLMSWVFAIPLARPVTDRFYRWFARNRYRLGCGDHCRARTP